VGHPAAVPFSAWGSIFKIFSSMPMKMEPPAAHGNHI
jgi:hypothetical protein